MPGHDEVTWSSYRCIVCSIDVKYVYVLKRVIYSISVVSIYIYIHTYILYIYIFIWLCVQYICIVCTVHYVHMYFVIYINKNAYDTYVYKCV